METDRIHAPEAVCGLVALALLSGATAQVIMCVLIIVIICIIIIHIYIYIHIYI